MINMNFCKADYPQGYDNWCPGPKLHDSSCRLDHSQQPRLTSRKYNILTLNPAEANPERSNSWMKGLQNTGTESVKDFGVLPDFNVDPVEIRIDAAGINAGFGTGGSTQKTV